MVSDQDPVIGMALDGEVTAKKSAPFGHLQKKKTKKERCRYDFPTKPMQLNDRAAHESMEQLENQFFKTSHSITPPPGSNNWAHKNYMFVSVDSSEGTNESNRPEQDRNVAGDIAQSAERGDVSFYKAAIKSAIRFCFVIPQFDNLFAYLQVIVSNHTERCLL